MTTATATIDFESSEFAPQVVERAPFAQIINPQVTRKGLAPFGFALTEENAKSTSFQLPEGWQLIDYEFKSGSVVPIYISKQPKLLIIASSVLYLKNAEKQIIGEMQDFPNWKQQGLKICSYKWCYILNQKNQPCHTIPIQISLNGASGAIFSTSWLNYKPRGGFCYDMEAAYAASKKQQPKPMGEAFHAHCVYEPVFEADERGKKPDTALVSVVSNYKPATMNQLISDKYLSEQIMVARESLATWKPRALMAQTAQAGPINQIPDERDW